MNQEEYIREELNYHLKLLEIYSFVFLTAVLVLFSGITLLKESGANFSDPVFVIVILFVIILYGLAFVMNIGDTYKKASNLRKQLKKFVKK